MFRSILEDASKIYPEIAFDLKCRWWYKTPDKTSDRMTMYQGSSWNVQRSSAPSQDIVRQTPVQECKSRVYVCGPLLDRICGSLTSAVKAF